MRSKRKIFAHSILLLAAAFLLTAAYLRVGIFPGRLQAVASERIRQWTGKDVTFEHAVFIPFHGLSLRQVRVFEVGGKPLFFARRVTVNARLLPFFREKKIVIDRLLLEGAQYEWLLEKPSRPAQPPSPKTVLGRLDIPVVPQNRPVTLKDLQHGPDILLPENVYIERIEISNATVLVRRRAGEEPVETLSSVNLRLTMPSPPLLRFEGRVALGQKAYASIDLTGAWDLKRDRYEFLLRTQSSEVPGWLIDYQQGHFLIFRDGRVSSETRLFSGEHSEMLFKTKAELKEAVFKLNEARYSGRLRLEAEGAFDTTTKRFDRYKGVLELVSVDAENVSDKIDELSGVSGFLRFEPDLLSVTSLRGRYKKILFDASGTLRSFKELLVNGDVHVHMSMDEIRALLPLEHRDSLRDFQIAGDCEAHAALSGSLKKGSKIAVENRLVLKNASLRNDVKKVSLTGLSGEVRMAANGIRLDHTRFLIADKPYTLSAFIPKNTGEAGSLHLGSPDLNLETDFTVEGDDLRLKNGHAAFAGGSANFSGKCLHWTDPWLELKGQSHVQLDRALARFAKPGAPTGFDLKGVLSGPFTLSGAWDRPADWDLKVDAKAGVLYWKGIHPLEEFELQVRMKNRRLDLPYIHASAYGGAVGCSLRVDLTRPVPHFEMRTALTNLDLSKVGPSLNPPRPELKGTLLAKLAVEGTLLDLGTWAGDGSISVTKGMVWQSADFKEMGHLPFVKVEGLDWVTFDELSATFRIRDRKLHTQDLSLFGDSVDVSLDGTISLDGALDMVMDIRFSDEVVQGARLTGGIAPMVVGRADVAIPQQHIGGTLSEPVTEKMLVPNARGAGKRLAGLAQGLAS